MQALNVFTVVLLTLVESQRAHEQPPWIDECLDAFCDVLKTIDDSWLLTPSDCMCHGCIEFFHKTIDMCMNSIGSIIMACIGQDSNDTHSVSALRIIPRMIAAGIPEFLLKFVQQKWTPSMRARAAHTLCLFVSVEAVAKSMLQQNAIQVLCDLAREYTPGSQASDTNVHPGLAALLQDADRNIRRGYDDNFWKTVMLLLNDTPTDFYAGTMRIDAVSALIDANGFALVLERYIMQDRTSA
jgi:hypothetical protein